MGSIAANSRLRAWPLDETRHHRHGAPRRSLLWQSQAPLRSRNLRMLRFSGEDVARGAAFRGPDPIRRIGSWPRKSAARAKSAPETPDIVNIRACSAPLRATVRLIEFRTGHAPKLLLCEVIASALPCSHSACIATGARTRASPARRFGRLALMPGGGECHGDHRG